MNDGMANLIRFGEDSVLEFKSVRVPGKRVVEPDSREIADDFAAAANAVGATFLFGVNDKTHEIEGVPIDKLEIVETWLRDICNDSVKPDLPATIRKVAALDSKGVDRCVIRVDVSKSLFVHEGPHGYFYRIGSSKRKMSLEMLARLFQQKSQTRFVCFDEQVVSDAEMKELVPALYSRLRTELSPSGDAEFLRKLHLIAPDVDGVMRPTVAGVLFATEHPESHLPSAFIQAVCYRGVERNADYQLDARDITGPLDVQIREACRFVERNMRIGAVKNPARIDIPQYAMNAVFEAIVNAVAHRDYSIAGSKIRLHMFADRLEIFSPGGLPNSLSLDEIGSRQFARNELICTCLARFPLPREFATPSRVRIIDRRGEGIPVIISDTGKLSGMLPKYRLLDDSELMLTIPSAPIDDREKLQRLVKGCGNVLINVPINTRTDGNVPVYVPVNAEAGSNVTINVPVKSAMQEQVFEIVVANPGINRVTIARMLDVDVRTVGRLVSLLKGRIEFRGAPKTGGYYCVAVSSSPALRMVCRRH